MKFKFVFAMVITLLPTLVAAQSHFTFCYDPYPPYTFGKTGTPTGGIKVDLLSAIFSEIDAATAEVVLLPWKQCQKQAKAGRIDGILPLFKNDERESYMVFSDSVFDQVSAFWYKRSKFPNGIEWETFSDIAHLKLGMLIGGYIDSDMESEFEAQHGIHRGKEVSILYKLLIKERVDLVAIDEGVGRYILHENEWQDKISMVEKPISSKASYFGLSKKSVASSYLEQINTAIAKLKDNGVIERIKNSTTY